MATPRLMPYTTYILFSESCRKTYIGQTQDLDKRMEKHNRVYVRSTKSCRPWTVIFTQSFETCSEVFRLESNPLIPA